jgi:hypothetical protein
LPPSCPHPRARQHGRGPAAGPAVPRLCNERRGPNMSDFGPPEPHPNRNGRPAAGSTARARPPAFRGAYFREA